MMISKNQLKNLAAYRLMKHCDEEGLFVVEGVKMAEETLRSGFVIRTLCATATWLQQHPSFPTTAEVLEIDEAGLGRLSQLRTPNEVWMLVERKSTPITPSLAASALTLVCDRIQDPGNLGTLLRTADWFGVRRVVCSPDTVSCYNPKVVQSTMGAIFRTEVTYTDLVPWVGQCGMPVYGAVLGGEGLYGSPLQLPAALVIGNESRGISPEVQHVLTHRITIPNLGATAESLNAAVAGAILMAEFLRPKQ